MENRDPIDAVRQQQVDIGSILDDYIENSKLVARLQRPEADDIQLEQDTFSIAATAVSQDPRFLSALLTKKWKNAIGPLTTLTKDGVSYQEAFRRKQQQQQQQKRITPDSMASVAAAPLYAPTVSADQSIAVQSRDIRFFQNGLPRTPLHPRIQVLSTSNSGGVINLAEDGCEEGHSGMQEDPVTQRKGKIRRTCQQEIFQNAKKADDEKCDVTALRELQNRLLKSTPTKSTDTLIQDSLDLGHSTPDAKDFLLAMIQP